DPHAAIVRRNQQDGAVVFSLLADAPMAAKLIAVILDRIALKRLERDDNHLVAGLLLFLRQHGDQPLARRWRQYACVVNDAAGQLGKGWVGRTLCQKSAQQDSHAERDARGQRSASGEMHQNLTCGTWVA